MKNTKERGITLIALIVTVIILLILAGVSISMVNGDGIFSRAKSASETYKAAANNETKILEEYENFMQEYTTGGSSTPTTPVTPPASTYTVSYNSNGGSGSIASVSAESITLSDGTGLTPPTNNPFKEWNTSADGTGISYQAGQTVTENLNLYAQWGYRLGQEVTCRRREILCNRRK